MHKRKHRKSDSRGQSACHSTENPDGTDPGLFIQAHEADIICGPRASSAGLLECLDPLVGEDSTTGLIRWGPERLDSTDADDVHQSSHLSLWVDRYDVRLLLDDLSDPRLESVPVRPPSPSGWSDLPSDSEDTFFFSPDELEDYRREKRRRLIDRGREERLKALASINGEEEDSDIWGGSDEEPDEAQRELIRRTALHIVSSPNPGQLEMRILANYGTDKRFAFLRGRWSRVWRTEKERARQHLAQEIKEVQSSTAPLLLGGLVSYGDSDSDNNSESANKQIETPKDVKDTPYTSGDQGAEDAIKEARRERAREWSARRRAEHSLPAEEA